MANRKAFNFYRSYYDVFKELDSKNKLLFIEALLDRQFTGVEPNLTGMSKFAYISQKSNIDSQIKGWEDKTGCKLIDSYPCQGGSEGGYDTPSQQEKEKEKEKEEVYRSFYHLSISTSENEELINLGYSQDKIDDIYDRIENFQNNKKYKSLKLTAKNWLKKEYPNINQGGAKLVSGIRFVTKADRNNGLKDYDAYDRLIADGYTFVVHEKTGLVRKVNDGFININQNKINVYEKL